MEVSLREKELLYILIGQGISLWTSGEHVMAEIFATLMDAPKRKAGLALYSINNFYSWLTLIDDLFSMDEHFSPLKSEWGAIAEKLKGLNDTRVRLAHHTSFKLDKGDEGVAIRKSPLDTRSKWRNHQPLELYSDKQILR